MSPPRRLRLLGESWVVFRDSSGQVGVLDEHCLHRRASLFFGRNEEGGLRCVYHGWKLATDGSLLDVPNERRPAGIMAKLKARSAKAVVRGGLLWVYLGPAEGEPAFPEFVVPENSLSAASRRSRPRDWEADFQDHRASFDHAQANRREILRLLAQQSSQVRSNIRASTV